MPNIPSPHGDKLNALLENKKLPAVDKANVQEAIERYNLWRSSILQASGSEENRIKACIKALNSYMNFIEYDLIFKSTEDFLYRQKGQLKLDNTVMGLSKKKRAALIILNLQENSNLLKFKYGQRRKR